jgi:NitT/TauT family transport system ATP-binding protein
MTTDKLTAVSEIEVPLEDVSQRAPGRPRLGGLTFAGVSKRFRDGTLALEDVSLTATAGEFVSVVGPSGCGKSTLLRMASGLTDATAGEIKVSADHIGFVFQDATLLPWRTVRRNVELLLELHGVARAERRRRAQDAIDTVGLAGSEDKFSRALSGGMKMRASLARSLTMSPEVFLFDEPFGALDEITRQRMNEEVLRLFKQRGFCGVFVTHSVAEAVFMSTRVLVMSGRPGRIVADIPIPFGFPRPPELRYRKEFGEVAGKVSEALKDGHR